MLFCMKNHLFLVVASSSPNFTSLDSIRVRTPISSSPSIMDSSVSDGSRQRAYSNSHMIPQTPYNVWKKKMPSQQQVLIL